MPLPTLPPEPEPVWEEVVEEAVPEEVVEEQLYEEVIPENVIVEEIQPQQEVFEEVVWEEPVRQRQVRQEVFEEAIWEEPVAPPTRQRRAQQIVEEIQPQRQVWEEPVRQVRRQPTQMPRRARTRSANYAPQPSRSSSSRNYEQRAASSSSSYGSGDREAAPRYGSNPEPSYPMQARRRGLQGTVMLRVLVDAGGNVADVRLAGSSGHSILDRAAMSSVRSWSFTPGMSGGRPRQMWVEVPVRFVLN